MVLAVGLAAAAIAGSRSLNASLRVDQTGRWFLCSTILNGVFLLVPLALLFFQHRKPLLSTLIPGNRIAQDFGWGLSLALLVASLNSLSVQRAVNLWINHVQTMDPSYYKMIFDIGDAGRGPGLDQHHAAFMRPLVLFAMSWGVFSPIAEEVFFRGFLYAALRRRVKAHLAVPISAAIFALFHYPYLEPMASAMILGVVVAVVYEYSGSLLAPIMTHMGLNLAFVLTMANGGELARMIPRAVFVAAAGVFALHFFLSSRYLFRKPR